MRDRLFKRLIGPLARCRGVVTSLRTVRGEIVLSSENGPSIGYTIVSGVQSSDLAVPAPGGMAKPPGKLNCCAEPGDVQASATSKLPIAMKYLMRAYTLLLSISVTVTV